MRVVVIGGTGHIGTYLLAYVGRGWPRGDFHFARGAATVPRRARPGVEIARVTLDRGAEEASGSFGCRVAELGAEVVIDLTCYQISSAEQLVETLRGRVGHFLHCGTIWVHGHSVVVPTKRERAARAFWRLRHPQGWPLRHTFWNRRATGFPATVLHPGHLVGPGWAADQSGRQFQPGGIR